MSENQVEIEKEMKTLYGKTQKMILLLERWDDASRKIVRETRRRDRGFHRWASRAETDLRTISETLEVLSSSSSSARVGDDDGDAHHTTAGIVDGGDRT